MNEELRLKRAAAGRMGGKVKVEKGFSTLPLEQVKCLSSKALATRWAKKVDV